MAQKPIIRNRQAALYGGIACILLGSVLLYDAYDNRGISRPFATRFLPGA